MPGHESKPEECDNCGWTTNDLHEVDAYARIRGHGPLTHDDEKEWAWLCTVCYSTSAGRAYQYPDQYENGDVMAVIAWGVNYIHDAIVRGRDA